MYGVIDKLSYDGNFITLDLIDDIKHVSVDISGLGNISGEGEMGVILR